MIIDFVNTTSLSCSLKKTEQTCTFQRPPYSKEDQVGACQILFNLKWSKQSKSELLVVSLPSDFRCFLTTRDNVQTKGPLINV